MREFLEFLKNNYVGLLILLAIVLVVIIFIERMCWIFGFGRYARDSQQPVRQREGLNYVLVDFFVKIINDFRSLLALTLIIIFAVTLWWALTGAGGDPEKISKALQAVMSTLGGLVGSIVGYYFGESAARKSTGQNPAPPPGNPVQGDPLDGGGGGAPPIKQAPTPPNP